jgi:hypothetical protein
MDPAGPADESAAHFNPLHICLQAFLAALRTPKIQMIRMSLKGPDDNMLCFELSSEAGTFVCVVVSSESFNPHFPHQSRASVCHAPAQRLTFLLGTR